MMTPTPVNAVTSLWLNIMGGQLAMSEPGSGAALWMECFGLCACCFGLCACLCDRAVAGPAVALMLASWVALLLVCHTAGWILQQLQ
jgi:hypothetical protein